MADTRVLSDDGRPRNTVINESKGVGNRGAVSWAGRTDRREGDRFGGVFPVASLAFAGQTQFLAIKRDRDRCSVAPVGDEERGFGAAADDEEYGVGAGDGRNGLPFPVVVNFRVASVTEIVQVLFDFHEKRISLPDVDFVGETDRDAGAFDPGLTDRVVDFGDTREDDRNVAALPAK